MIYALKEYQNCKKIYICIIRFTLKENKITKTNYLANQASSKAKKRAIVKERIESYKKYMKSF